MNVVNSTRHAVGSLLIVGLYGTSLSDHERAWLRLIRPGGIILFKRNIEDAGQTRALLDEATSVCAPHAARCVDVEGGTVNRLRDALGPIPSAQAVTRAMSNQSGKPARDHGDLIARAVRSFGFNTTLAPVVDLGLRESADVLGSRAPSADPRRVVHYASHFLAGLAAHGIAGCAKHFPGLGGAAGDTHFETPQIRRPGRLLWKEDLFPYRCLHADMPMIMTNHAAYPSTKGGNLPASASLYWIKTMLRKRIGYRGLILSDDLEMGGIVKFMPIEEAAVAVLRAGADMLLMCHNIEPIMRVYETLLSEAESSRAFNQHLHSRAQRAESLRAQIYPRAFLRAPSASDFDSLRRSIEAFRQTIEAATEFEILAPRAISPAENA